MDKRKFCKSLHNELKKIIPDLVSMDLTQKLANKIIDHQREQLQQLTSFNEPRFQNFINKGTQILWTPKAILHLTYFLDHFLESDIYEKSPQYQKARELYDAIRPLIALKKIFGIEFCVCSSESPDFIFVPAKGLDKFLSQKFDEYEFMSIPSIVTRNWDKKQHIKETFNFIVNHDKFGYAYGSDVGLIFHIYLDSNTFSSKALSKMFLDLPNGKIKFSSIWMTVWTSIDSKNYAMVQLYPNYNIVNLSNDEKLELLY